MEQTTKKSVFEEKVISKIEGDNKDIIAQRNARTAKSIAEAQIAGLKGNLVDCENELEEAKERYDETVYSSSKITNRKEYWKSVVNAKDSVSRCEDDLQNVKDSIKFAENFISENF